MVSPAAPSVCRPLLVLNIEGLPRKLVAKHLAAREPFVGLCTQRCSIEIELADLLEPGPELLQVLVVLFEFGIGELARRALGF